MYRLSTQAANPELALASQCDDVEADVELDDEQTVPLQIKLQSFVCCLYGDHPWIGMVDEISKEFGDSRIDFMHPHGPAKQFQWPSSKARCWNQESDILCSFEAPSFTSSSSRAS